MHEEHSSGGSGAAVVVVVLLLVLGLLVLAGLGAAAFLFVAVGSSAPMMAPVASPSYTTPIAVDSDPEVLVPPLPTRALRISAEGTVLWKGAEFPLAELADRLPAMQAELGPDEVLLIEADAGAPAEVVDRVVEACSAISYELRRTPLPEPASALAPPSE